MLEHLPVNRQAHVVRTPSGDDGEILLADKGPVMLHRIFRALGKPAAQVNALLIAFKAFHSTSADTRHSSRKTTAPQGKLHACPRRNKRMPRNGCTGSTSPGQKQTAFRYGSGFWPAAVKSGKAGTPRSLHSSIGLREQSLPCGYIRDSGTPVGGMAPAPCGGRVQPPVAVVSSRIRWWARAPVGLGAGQGTRPGRGL